MGGPWTPLERRRRRRRRRAESGPKGRRRRRRHTRWPLPRRKRRRGGRRAPHRREAGGDGGTTRREPGRGGATDGRVAGGERERHRASVTRRRSGRLGPTATLTFEFEFDLGPRLGQPGGGGQGGRPGRGRGMRSTHPNCRDSLSENSVKIWYKQPRFPQLIIPNRTDTTSDQC